MFRNNRELICVTKKRELLCVANNVLQKTKKINDFILMAY